MEVELSPRPQRIVGFGWPKIRRACCLTASGSGCLGSGGRTCAGLRVGNVKSKGLGFGVSGFRVSIGP